MVASTSSSTPTKSYSSRQQRGSFGGSLYFLSGFLSHLLTLSLLRNNFLPLLFDVMLDHSHVISACNTTAMSAQFSRSNKFYEFVEFMLCYLLLYTWHACCVYVYIVHVRCGVDVRGD